MVIVLGPAFSQKLLVVISVYNLTFCSSFHGRSHTEFLLPLHNRLHILIRDRLDDIPIFIEHLNIAAAVAHAFDAPGCQMDGAPITPTISAHVYEVRPRKR